MESTEQEIRHILSFYFLRGKNATKAAEKFCEVYGPDTVTIRTAQRRFDRFRSGVVDVESTPRTGNVTFKVFILSGGIFYSYGQRVIELIL